MKLIAKKPCSFGGKKFLIGDEIPAQLVHNPIQQEKYGTLTIREEESAAPVEKEVRSEPSTKKAPAKKGGKKPAEEAGEQ